MKFRRFSKDPRKLDPIKKSAKIYSTYLDYWISIKLTVNNIKSTVRETVTRQELARNSQKFAPSDKAWNTNSRKFVPAKHKKSAAIREIKLPRKFHATR